MNREPSTHRSIGTLFTVLLSALFLLFLLVLLLFFAQLYRNNVHSASVSRNLYTAASYLETKFRQHDAPDLISVGEIQGNPALLFEERLSGNETCQTAIYLHEGSLRELFYVPETQLSADLGASIADLSAFDFRREDSGWLLSLTDPEGTHVSLLLHPGVPVTALGKEDSAS